MEDDVLEFDVRTLSNQRLKELISGKFGNDPQRFANEELRRRTKKRLDEMVKKEIRIDR